MNPTTMTLRDLLCECELSLVLARLLERSHPTSLNALRCDEHSRTHAPLASRAVIELARRLRVAEEALRLKLDNPSWEFGISCGGKAALTTLQAPLDV